MRESTCLLQVSDLLSSAGGAPVKKVQWTDDDDDIVPPSQLDQTLPTEGSTPQDVNLVGQTGCVQIGGQVATDTIGAATNGTPVVQLSRTQRHNVISKTFRRTWQVYVHGHFPENIVNVPSVPASGSRAAQPGYTIVDEGRQIMPCTTPAAAITTAELQRACIGASVCKVTEPGYKILFHKTLRVEAVPNADKDPTSDLLRSEFYTHAHRRQVQKGACLSVNEDNGHMWLAGRDPEVDGLGTQ